MENQTISFAEKRKNFMEDFAGNPILSKKLPEIAAGLMKAEFGVNIYDHSHIPIVFTTGWSEVSKVLRAEQADECAADVCGCRLEYVTDYSDSDKNTNIVPQMRHLRTPLFQKRDKNVTIGASYNDQLQTSYNAWRSVYALETLSGIENRVFDIVLNTYGINLMVPIAIYPTIGATYAAGIELAKELKTTINMYNVFNINVSGDTIILTPLAALKQGLKHDSKKFD